MAAPSVSQSALLNALSLPKKCSGLYHFPIAIVLSWHDLAFNHASAIRGCRLTFLFSRLAMVGGLPQAMPTELWPI